MPTFKDWIAGRTAEGTPVDADELYLRDDSGDVSKRVTWSVVKSTLDAVTNAEVDADIKTLSLPASTTISAFGATLVDDADAATARTTLGAPSTGDVGPGSQLVRTPTWWSVPPGSPGVSAVTLNRLYFYPLLVGGEGMSIDRIGCRVSTAGGAGSVTRLGIYASDANDAPGALVVDGGTVDCTTTGDKSVTIAETLSAGVYWIAAAPQVAVPVLRSQAIANGGAPYGMSVSAQGNAMEFPGVVRQDSVSGALPDPAAPDGITTVWPRLTVRFA